MDHSSTYSLYVPSNYHEEPPLDPDDIVNRDKVYQCETLFLYVYARTTHEKGTPEYQKWYNEQVHLEMDVGLESVLITGGQDDSVQGSASQDEGVNSLLTPVSILSEMYTDPTDANGDSTHTDADTTTVTSTDTDTDTDTTPLSTSNRTNTGQNSNSSCSWRVIPLDSGDVVFLVQSSLRRLSPIEGGSASQGRKANDDSCSAPASPAPLLRAQIPKNKRPLSTVKAGNPHPNGMNGANSALNSPAMTPLGTPKRLSRSQAILPVTSNSSLNMSEGNLLNVRNRGSSVSSSDGGSRVSGKGVRLRLTISSWATTEHELHNNSPTEKERFLEEILTDLVNERDPQDDALDIFHTKSMDDDARLGLDTGVGLGFGVGRGRGNHFDNPQLRTRPVFSAKLECVLRIKSAPSIAYKQSTIGNIRYISIRLENTQDPTFTVRDCQLYISASKDAKSIMEASDNNMGWHVSRRWDDFPTNLLTHESISVVFAVEPYSIDPDAVNSDTAKDKDKRRKSSSANTTHKPQLYDSMVSIAVGVTPLMERRQCLMLQYQLLAANATQAELSISVKVPELVLTKEQFTVHFTIANTTSKTRDVSLILHQPRRSDATSKDKTLLTDARGTVLVEDELADAQAIMLQDESRASLVCLDETVYLGRIDANTTKLAAVNFFAFRSGSYELALAHLYDHPSKSFLSAKCPSTYVYVSDIDKAH